LAKQVTYTGNPKHKTYPSPAGPPAKRADAAKCDKYAVGDWPKLQCALQMAIRAGSVGEFRGRFPFRAWIWINGVLHEARQTNRGTGDYHGFPLNDPTQYPVPLDQLKAVPHVEIPVA
jgi:hypothetical protein